MAQLRRLPRAVVPGAVAVAGTGHDHHDQPLGGFATGTLEIHEGGLGSVGGAAASVHAGATVARLVGQNAATVLVGEVHGRFAPQHPLALTASLQEDTHTHVIPLIGTSKHTRVESTVHERYLRCNWCQLRLVPLVVAGSDRTQATLLHHFTLAILVGDSGGKPHATGLRAGSPLRGLLNAVQAGVPTGKSHRFLLTIG